MFAAALAMRIGRRKMSNQSNAEVQIFNATNNRLASLYHHFLQAELPQV